MANETTALIVSPDTIAREGARDLLANAGYAVLDACPGIEQACTRASERVDLVLVIAAADAETVESLKALRQTYPTSRIVLSLQRIDAALGAFLESLGSRLDGCLSADASPDVLRRSLELIMLGQPIYPFAALAAGRSNVGGGARAGEPALTERERQILSRIGEGKSNKLIARDLQLSVATIKIHVKTLLRKIGADNRTQAAIWVARRGLPPEKDE